MVERHREARGRGWRGEGGAAGGRAVLIVAAFALVASGAFSVGELQGARHTPNDGSSAPAASTQSNSPAASSNPLSGLSLSSLKSLESQVSQAEQIAKLAQSATGGSTDLSQLEQQLGITPSGSTSGDVDQLQTELNNINACLGSSSTSSSSC